MCWHPSSVCVGIRQFRQRMRWHPAAYGGAAACLPASRTLFLQRSVENARFRTGEKLLYSKMLLLSLPSLECIFLLFLFVRGVFLFFVFSYYFSYCFFFTFFGVRTEIRRERGGGGGKRAGEEEEEGRTTYAHVCSRMLTYAHVITTSSREVRMTGGGGDHVSIRQHTSAYVSIRQRMLCYPSATADYKASVDVCRRMAEG